jgi:ABC-2 type transport system permease protein
MNDPVMSTRTATSPVKQPSFASMAWQATVLEAKQTFRDPAAVGFGLIFPIALLLLFATIFSGKVVGTDVTFSQLYVAGIIGSSIMSQGFVGLSIDLAVKRENGVLKRLASTPMPKAVFFVSAIAATAIVCLLQIVVLLVIGVTLYGIKLPSDPGKWLTFAWVWALGLVASCLMGIAIGSLIKSSKSAPAVVNLPFVALQFVSGVFVPYSQIRSEGIRVFASLFPLKWLVQGTHSVFLPSSFAAQEPAGKWEHPMVALALLAWVVLGFLFCMRFFRWTTKK